MGLAVVRTLLLKTDQIQVLFNDNLDTIFLVPGVENNFLSSSIVKEVALFGGDVSKLVPEAVNKYFKKIKR